MVVFQDTLVVMIDCDSVIHADQEDIVDARVLKVVQSSRN